MPNLQDLHIAIQLVRSGVHDLERSLRIPRPISPVMLRDLVSELRTNVEWVETAFEHLLLAESDKAPPPPPDTDIPF